MKREQGVVLPDSLLLPPLIDVPVLGFVLRFFIQTLVLVSAPCINGGLRLEWPGE